MLDPFQTASSFLLLNPSAQSSSKPASNNLPESGNSLLHPLVIKNNVILNPKAQKECGAKKFPQQFVVFSIFTWISVHLRNICLLQWKKNEQPVTVFIDYFHCNSVNTVIYWNKNCFTERHVLHLSYSVCLILIWTIIKQFSSRILILRTPRAYKLQFYSKHLISSFKLRVNVIIFYSEYTKYSSCIM